MIRTDFHTHVGVRVADLRRAASFYIDVLGGRMLTLPFEVTGPRAEHIYGGPPGVRVFACHVQFETGAIELCEFVEPRVPERQRRPSPGGPFPHVGLRVSDVVAAHARVEPAGGRLLSEIVWSVDENSGRSIFFCEDPDGNALEVSSGNLDSSVSLIHAHIPSAVPSPERIAQWLVR